MSAHASTTLLDGTLVRVGDYVRITKRPRDDGPPIGAVVPVVSFGFDTVRVRWDDRTNGYYGKMKRNVEFAHAQDDHIDEGL